MSPLTENEGIANPLSRSNAPFCFLKIVSFFAATVCAAQVNEIKKMNKNKVAFILIVFILKEAI
jgi:hypothetical protein